MRYTLTFTRQAAKELKSLPKNMRHRIEAKLEQLAKNPDSPALDTKKLSGIPLFRLRVGNYRVIYDRQDAQLIIKVVKLGHRQQIYQ